MCSTRPRHTESARAAPQADRLTAVAQYFRLITFPFARIHSLYITAGPIQSGATQFPSRSISLHTNTRVHVRDKQLQTYSFPSVYTKVL